MSADGDAVRRGLNRAILPSEEAFAALARLEAAAADAERLASESEIPALRQMVENQAQTIRDAEAQRDTLSEALRKIGQTFEGAEQCQAIARAALAEVGLEPRVPTEGRAR